MKYLVCEIKSRIMNWANNAAFMGDRRHSLKVCLHIKGKSQSGEYIETRLQN
jgi:hypothetical protein